MPEFAIKDRGGSERFAEVQKLPEQGFKETLGKTFGNVEFFLGTTAVHGLEPQQIAANVGLAMNKTLKENGLEERPIILPFVPGDPIYGERNVRVLKEVYTGDQAKKIFLSKELGEILVKTEFGLEGYEVHLESVRDKQGEVQEALDRLLTGEFSAISLDGQEERIFNSVTADGTRGRVIEINTGANVSAATEDGRITAHSVFPNTLDGLMKMIEANEGVFNYNPDLVRDIKAIADKLRTKFGVIVLPDIRPFAGEQDEIIAPPLKDPLESPDVTINTEAKTISISWEEEVRDLETGEMKTVTRVESAANYDSEKGVIYLNVSGSGIGVKEAKGFVALAQEQGYSIAAPAWLKEKWIVDAGTDEAEKAKFEKVLAAGPHLLFAKDTNGDPICVAQMLRAGLGSISNSQIAGKDGEGIPMIVLPWTITDNPEMWGNVNVLVEEGLGVEYIEKARDAKDIIEKAKALNKTTRRRFYEKVRHTLPESMRDLGGLQFVAEVLIRAEMESILRAEGNSS